MASILKNSPTKLKSTMKIPTLEESFITPII